MTGAFTAMTTPGSASRPLIGVTTYLEPAAWGSWSVDTALLPADYLTAVRGGGATPLLIPPLGPGDDAASVVRRLDGLVLAGGADVNPSRYGHEPHPSTGRWRDERDVSELALLQAADDRGLPVLGVCRGMQIMAVAAGGTLHQHVPDLVGEELHCPGPRDYGAVEIAIVPDTRLAAILGPVVRGACHHHQAVAVHPDMRAAAFARDGVLEAIETPGSRFRLGVQWHAETQPDTRLFRALAVAAMQTAAVDTA